MVTKEGIDEARESYEMSGCTCRGCPHLVLPMRHSILYSCKHKDAEIHYDLETRYGTMVYTRKIPEPDESPEWCPLRKTDHEDV